MALSEIDRNLLSRCLAEGPRAWEDFVDRFMGLVVHVITHSARSRSLQLTAEDREDLASEVFYTLVKDNFAVLRQFRGEASLATYLTVIARRVVVTQLLKRKAAGRLVEAAAGLSVAKEDDALERLSDREEVERMLEDLSGAEAEVVRLYHLEGKSYREISAAAGIPENSIGPTLARARQKMRSASADPAVG